MNMNMKMRTSIRVIQSGLYFDAMFVLLLIWIILITQNDLSDQTQKNNED